MSAGNHCYKLEVCSHVVLSTVISYHKKILRTSYPVMENMTAWYVTEILIITGWLTGYIVSSS